MSRDQFFRIPHAKIGFFNPFLVKKKAKNFFLPDMTIHTPIESPCRVDPRYVDFKNVFCYFRPKIPYKSL